MPSFKMQLLYYSSSSEEEEEEEEVEAMSPVVTTSTSTTNTTSTVTTSASSNTTVTTSFGIDHATTRAEDLEVKTADTQTLSGNIWLALALAGFGICVTIFIIFIFKMKRRLQNAAADADEEAERESTNDVVDPPQKEYNTKEKAEDEKMEKPSPPTRPSSLLLGATAHHKLKLSPLLPSPIIPAETKRRGKQWRIVSKKESLDECTPPTLMSAKKFSATEEDDAQEEAANELNEAKETIRKMHAFYIKKESEKMAPAGHDVVDKGATGQDDDVNDKDGKEVACAEEVEKEACGEDGRKMVSDGGGGEGKRGDAVVCHTGYCEYVKHHL